MSRILKRSIIAASLCALSMATIAPLTFAADTPAQAQCHLGDSAIEAKQYAEAIGHFDKALQLDSSCWKAYGGRGAARYNNGDYKGALSDFKTALQHYPDNQKLKDLISTTENQLNGGGGGAANGGGGSDMAARREAARQMLLNAQFGNDITNPGFQILMAARRRAGLNPFTGMPANYGLGGTIAAAAQNKAFVDPNATTSNSVTSKLEAMSKGVHIKPQTNSVATGSAHATSTEDASSFQNNALQDSLSSKVSSLPPPNMDSVNSASATQTESASFSEPTQITATSGVTLNTPAPGGSLVTPLSARPGRHGSQQNNANGPRLSADNNARDPKTNMTAQDYYDRACGKGKAMDFQGALKDYDEAIKLNPNHGPAYANRGSTRFNSGDHKGALEDFDMAVQLMPDNAGVRALRERVTQLMTQH